MRMSLCFPRRVYSMLSNLSKEYDTTLSSMLREFIMLGILFLEYEVKKGGLYYLSNGEHIRIESVSFITLMAKKEHVDDSSREENP